MKTCTYIEITSKGYQDCDNLCEGYTEFCATHNRKIRKEQKEALNAIVKRQALLSKPKKVYAKPNKVSEKRLHENVEYLILRSKFITENPHCKAQVNGYCTEKTEDVHHKSGRVGKNFLDTTTFLPVCRSCHTYIESHPQEAKEKGWSMSRLQKQEPTV